MWWKIFRRDFEISVFENIAARKEKKGEKGSVVVRVLMTWRVKSEEKMGGREGGREGIGH